MFYWTRPSLVQWLVTLSAPSHCSNQHWIIVQQTKRKFYFEIQKLSFKKIHSLVTTLWWEVMWHSPESFFTGSDQVAILYNEFETYTLKITTTSPRGQWVWSQKKGVSSQIARHIGPTLAQRGSCRLHVGPTWCQRSLLSGIFHSTAHKCLFNCRMVCEICSRYVYDLFDDVCVLISETNCYICSYSHWCWYLFVSLNTNKVKIYKMLFYLACVQ